MHDAPVRILIADDDRTSRTMIAGVLRKMQYAPIEVDNGLSALQMLSSADAPKIAILDWMMPQMSGLHVLRKLRNDSCEDPCYVILLTARTCKEDIIFGLNAGANDYLCKPFDSGELLARVNVGRRVTQLQADLLESRRLLEYQATHDALTRFLNRRAIFDVLSKEVARSERYPEWGLTIGVCDLDLFKHINDKYGHVAGDKVLEAVAGVMFSRLREYDMVGRVGGEEFLVILTEKGTESDAHAVFERLRAGVAACSVEIQPGVQIKTSISIGYAAFRAGLDVTSLYAMADEALYAAKRQGRNRVIAYV